MFKKFFSRFSPKPSPEATQAPPPQSDGTPPADEGRSRRRRRPRKPAGERQQGPGQTSDQAEQGQRPAPGRDQSDRSQGDRATDPAREGDSPHKRRRRRRKPASERAANAAAQADAPSDTRDDARDDRRDEPRAPRDDSGDRQDERDERPERRQRSSRGGKVDAITGDQPRTEYFGDIRVSKPVAAALADMGYETPTPIQAEVIVPMLDGIDLVGQAQTGTGKTAGFGIPLAEKIDGGLDYVQAIVLVPTRELAQQVSVEISNIFKYRGIKTVAVYGGAPIGRQIIGLEDGAHMVVGTPGRVIDLLNRGHLRLDKVLTVVLDEADQMLDIGFLPDIRTILRQTNRDRQTALFTATVPTQIRRLIYSYLNDPQTIRVGEESETVENVRQMYAEVARRDKLDALKEVFETIDAGEQTLVFRRTQEDVDWLVRMLKQRGMPADAIHGGLSQGERNTVMQSFRDGKLKILVSTNLTSRGIDVPDIAHVINYDCPEQVEEYVHRIGRTARMGREGTAVTFVGEWDMEFFDAIRDHVGAEKLEEIHLSMYGDPNRGGPVDENDPELEVADDQPTTAATDEPSDDQPADDADEADEPAADEDADDDTLTAEADVADADEDDSDTDDDASADDSDEDDDEPEAPAGELGRPAN
jgi:superfamily II DNA/RNA helicase